MDVMAAIEEQVGHHAELAAFVSEYASLMRPDRVRVCTGSQEEYDELCNVLVDAGVYTRLDAERRPNSFLARSDPRDVARSEGATIIAAPTRKEAGPTNNWREPEEMRANLRGLFEGCMEGRTLYVIPFSMGPVGGPLSLLAVQLTDSEYVVTNSRIMTRMGTAALDALGTDGAFVRCVHSVGYPLADGRPDTTWPCNVDNRWIVHYPHLGLIESFGSGYGGNALLGKKCLALRLASVMGRADGWLAEHMLITGFTPPDETATKYICAAFPSQCGKTNFAMLEPSLPGWRVSTVGDDIAWLRFLEDAEGVVRLHAINPEAGLFGVAPGTSAHTNPNALAALARDCIFTNVGLTPDGDVWWEELTEAPPPAGTLDWRGAVWDPAGATPCAHPNSRFTAPLANCPVLDPAFHALDGVPVDAILFGGRRPSTVPLVTEAASWEHGVFMGASIASEKTAAADGAVGHVRRDPFAMLPFCGYNYGDYFAHWLAVGARGASPGHALPRIYMTNWFRGSPDAKFLWPGFGANIHVVAWILARAAGTLAPEFAVDTPIGVTPAPAYFDAHALGLPEQWLDELLRVDPDEWLAELDAFAAYAQQFGDRFPPALTATAAAIRHRLVDAHAQ